MEKDLQVLNDWYIREEHKNTIEIVFTYKDEDSRKKLVELLDTHFRLC